MEDINGGFDPEWFGFLIWWGAIARRDRSELVRELVARQVIALAERGLRDPNKLVEAVTSSLSFHRGPI
jgi:hypothetical protein